VCQISVHRLGAKVMIRTRTTERRSRNRRTLIGTKNNGRVSQDHFTVRVYGRTAPFRKPPVKTLEAPK
jgi:hypothetical protein